ncbi:MAG: multidrug efflux SMR transporter [Mariprofundaceae bacterium]|nr:multidrug efflux SMR transporter [Mariprofundaceae bacterium]
MQHWLFLCSAIVFEVAGTVAMKFSDAFTKLIPSLWMAFFYVVSIIFLTLSLKKIELSIAYAVWAGVGTALIALIGIIYFKEPASIVKIVSLTLIIAGVVGLNLSGSKH